MGEPYHAGIGHSLDGGRSIGTFSSNDALLSADVSAIARDRGASGRPRVVLARAAHAASRFGRSR